MSDETTTPAARLLELVQAGRSKGRADKLAGAVWAEVLGVEHNSPDYICLVADINRMIADLIRLVAVSPIKDRARENYDRTLRHILGAFQGPRLDTDWGQTLKNHLTDNHIDHLENLDSQLSHGHPIGRISDEQIDEIKADIDHVREQLDRSELPTELNKLLRSHVEAIRRVLAHYNIYGNEGLYEALTRILGELNLCYEVFQQHGDSDAVKAYPGFPG